MAVGVIDRKSLGRGGGIESAITGEEGQRRVLRMDFEGRGELSSELLGTLHALASTADRVALLRSEELPKP